MREGSAAYLRAMAPGSHCCVRSSRDWPLGSDTARLAGHDDRGLVTRRTQTGRRVVRADRSRVIEEGEQLPIIGKEPRARVTERLRLEPITGDHAEDCFRVFRDDAIAE